MSSLIFLKDHKRHKKGDGPVTVPFVEARDLVRDGVAAYWMGGKSAAHPAAADQGAELARLRKEHAADLRRLEKEHAAEAGKLRAELEAANKLLAESAGKK